MAALLALSGLLVVRSAAGPVSAPSTFTASTATTGAPFDTFAMGNALASTTSTEAA